MITFFAATISVALALPVQAVPASAQEEKQPEQVEAKPVLINVVVDDPNREICKRTALAGSSIKKRVCATKAEWEALARHSRNTTRELKQTRGSFKGG